jgi:16S rRNA G966 N2-methylase RsmD
LNHHAGWGDVADRSVFFDVCAGSGIVGLEAMSRGAGRVVFVDSDGRSLKYVVDNLKILSPEEHARTFVFRGTAERFLRGGWDDFTKGFPERRADFLLRSTLCR